MLLITVKIKSNSFLIKSSCFNLSKILSMSAKTPELTHYSSSNSEKVNDKSRKI